WTCSIVLIGRRRSRLLAQSEGHEAGLDRISISDRVPEHRPQESAQTKTLTPISNSAGDQGLTLVGARGFEPPTPCAQGRCATRLRYAPKRPGIVAARHQQCN